MELGLKIIKNSINGIISILTEPSVIIIIALCILMKVFYPKLRGYNGEQKVKKALKKLSNEYTTINDVMIKNENGTHQIDHIVISKFGIFVIEMKNYYGMITGTDFTDRWIQYLGKNKYNFKNPINQNYGHVKVLEELLRLENSKFVPIVCFSNDVKLKIKSKNIVVQLDNLVETITKFNNQILQDNIDEIVNIIKANNIVDRQKRKKHVEEIKNKLKEENNKVNDMICPKCGGKLVLKNGKYGNFIGCSNYPKCHYIKK